MAVSVLFRINQNGHIEVLNAGPTPDVTFDANGCSQTRLSHPCVMIESCGSGASPDPCGRGLWMAELTFERLQPADGSGSVVLPLRG